MNRIATICIMLIAMMLCLTAEAQKNPQAKKILDATAKKFNSAKGIEATFKMSNTVGGIEQAAGGGQIQLKGKKYKLTAGDQITWFDGKTLWSYSKDIEEVNVTTPTKKEMQSMNPYSFVGLYKSGYNYNVKNVTSNNTTLYEVRLTAENPKSDMPEIVINITKDYTPVSIRMRQGKSWSKISITKFNASKSFADTHFTFPKSQYPDAEIIDMR